MKSTNLESQHEPRERGERRVATQAEMLHRACPHGAPHADRRGTSPRGAKLAFLAVRGILGPCVSFSLDCRIFSFFFSLISFANCRISPISSSSLSGSLSYSPAAALSSSSFSNSSSFFKKSNEQNRQWKHINKRVTFAREPFPEPSRPSAVPHKLAGISV